MHAARNSWARATSGGNLSRSAEPPAHNSAARVDAQVAPRCGVGIRRSCPGFVDGIAQRREGAGEQVAAPQVATLPQAVLCGISKLGVLAGLVPRDFR